MAIRIYNPPSYEVEFTHTMYVPPGTTVSESIPGHVNRGIASALDVEEVGGEVSGNYDFDLYPANTFVEDDLAYRALNIDPAAAYVDRLPFQVKDKDEASEAHIRIRNLDATKGATFNITMRTEKFR